MLFNLVQKFSAAADAKEMKQKSCIYFSCGGSHYCYIRQSSDITGRFAFNHQVDPGLTSYFWFSTCSCFNLAFQKKKQKKKHLYKLENGACQEQNRAFLMSSLLSCAGLCGLTAAKYPRMHFATFYRDFEPETITCFVLVLFLGHFFKSVLSQYSQQLIQMTTIGHLE